MTPAVTGHGRPGGGPSASLFLPEQGAPCRDGLGRGWISGALPRYRRQWVHRHSLVYGAAWRRPRGARSGVSCSGGARPAGGLSLRSERGPGACGPARCPARRRLRFSPRRHRASACFSGRLSVAQRRRHAGVGAGGAGRGCLPLCIYEQRKGQGSLSLRGVQGACRSAVAGAQPQCRDGCGDPAARSCLRRRGAGATGLAAALGAAASPRVAAGRRAQHDLLRRPGATVPALAALQAQRPAATRRHRWPALQRQAVTAGSGRRSWAHTVAARATALLLARSGAAGGCAARGSGRFAVGTSPG